jgi:hypothetical protein
LQSVVDGEIDAIITALRVAERGSTS